MASVWGELRRRNVVKVAVAYAIVGWLLVEVSSVLLPAFEAPDWVLRVIVLLIVIGFVLALVLSWAYEITPDGMKRSHEVAATESISHVTGRKLDFAIIGALVLALGFVVYNYVLDDGEMAAGVLPNSVAVIPFENMSVDPEEAFYAAGIHEEILNQLVKLSALNVIARTSMQQYANTEKSIPEIARELNVETVMEGSVRYAGGQIRITAQLNDGITGAHLWSETYTRDFEDIFAIESDVAMNVANAVGAEFSLEEQASIEKAPTESHEAYSYYLRSQASANPNAWILLLDQAIEADPNFALAYAQKAFFYTFNLVGLSGAGPDEAAELERLVRVNAEQALALDPTLGIAQAALAVPYYVNWRGAEAEQAFRQAIELSQKDVNVLVLYGRFKRYRGEFDASIELLRRAAELDPNNAGTLNQLAINYRQAENWEAAAAVYSDVLDLAPATNIAFNLGSATVEAVRGNHAEALRQLQIAETLEPNAFRLSQMAHVYSLVDRPRDAMRFFTELERIDSEDPVGDAVWIRAYMAVGDYEEALQRLESAVQNRTPTDLAALAGIAANPWGDPELDKPEFRELLDDLWGDE